MVKVGPCNHCGTERSPMWRNGPPLKPVLCNACGSRWKVRKTLKLYVPKRKLLEEIYKNSSSGSGSSNETGLSEPNVIIPKRRRTSLDQFVLSPMERFHKQLYDIAHERPGVFFKEPVVGDFLIDQSYDMIFAQTETALGAIYLGSPPKELERTQSLSSTNVKQQMDMP